MKTLTIPGKHYMVRSSTGCTVTQETSPGKYITAIVPADEDTPVFAHAGKFDVDDEGAIVTEVFKSAPIAFGGGGKPGWYDVLRSELAELLGADNFSLTYAWREDKFTLTYAVPLYITDEQMAQVRVLLGSIPPRNLVTEMDPFPGDFTRLEFLENTGTQYIDTLLKPVANMSIRTKLQTTYYQNSAATFGAVGTAFNSEYNFIFMPQIRRGSSVWAFCRWAGLEGNIVNEYEEGVPYLLELKDKKVYANGEAVKWTYQNAADKMEGSSSYLLFAVYNAQGKLSISPGMRCYELNDSVGESVRCSLIPTLDQTGAPCMFDLVTRQPFPNNGTGAFIAGIETQKQLDAMLRKLPDRTGQDIGTLQVRLADELQTPENEARLDAMMAKNWEISQAA